MLRRLTSGLEEVYSTAGPLFDATREIAVSTSPAAIIEVLRKHILDEAIDRITITQIGFGSSGEAITEAGAVFDKQNIAAKPDIPDAVRQRIGQKPLILSNLAGKDGGPVEVYEYMAGLQVMSLAIFPLIGHDRTVGYLLLASREPYNFTEIEIATLEILASQVAIVLSNRSLLNAISRKTESLNLVNDISLGLAGALDLELLGDVLKESLSKAHSISHVSLTLHEAGHNRAKVHTFLGETLPDEVTLADSVFQQALDSRQMVQSPDVSSLPDGRMWRAAKVSALIVIPLVGHERKLGTLNVGTQSADTILEEQGAVYEQVASLVVTALENIRLFDRLQVSLDETAALYSTSLAMNAAQSLEEAYETALSEMAQLSGSDRIELYLAGPDPRGSVEFVETVALWKAGALQEHTRTRYPIAEAPVLSQFPQSRANLIFNDLAGDRRLDEALRNQLIDRRVTNLMMIPLSTGTTWLGALLLEGYAGEIFTNDQARLCRNIADQAALVVDSQLLLLRAQQAAEREHALRDIAAALSSTLDSESVLQIVLENLDHVLLYDAANILVVEEGIARPIVMRGYREMGVDEDNLRKQFFQIGAAENLRRMRDQKRPVIISNTSTYPDWVHTPDTDWIGSYIGAPIYIEDQLLGFLSVDSRMRDFYTEEHATLLQAFADQAAVAIRNSQRFQESRVRTQREELVGNIAAQLQRVSTVEDVLETAARTLQQALGDYDVALRLTVNPPEESARQSLPDSLGDGT